MRRRRRVLGLAGLGALAIGIIIGADHEAEGPKKAALPPQCTGSKPKDVQRIVGMKLVVRWDGTPDAGLERRIREGDVGGVIVFPTVDAESLATNARRLQRVATKGGGLPLLVAIDQEGGDVKRLPGPPSVGAPAMTTPEQARSEGLATGRYLLRAGVNVDLAPVLDVASPGSPLASRSFGSDPSEVSRLGLAFAQGLGTARIAATAKHYPGLGRSTVNTDTTASEVDASREEIRRDLEPFTVAATAGVPLIMASLATYPAFGIHDPAALSSTAIAILRNRLGFQGVVITDDLGAQAVAASIPAPEAAVRAAQAGSDLLLFALDPDPPVFDHLAKAAGTKRLHLRRLRNSCVRIVGLRGSLEVASPDG